MEVPYSWMGGKRSLATKIIQMFPTHLIYVEPFFGSGAVYFNKQPSSVEVINDLDGNITNFFRVLRSPELFKLFYDKMTNAPFSREEIIEQYNVLKCPGANQVDRAFAFFFVIRQCFGSKLRPNSQAGWGYTIMNVSGNTAGAVNRFLNSIERLPEIRDRLLHTMIENDDGLAVIKRFDTAQTLFYIDPPYHPCTRKHGIYTQEMDEDAHKKLVDYLLEGKGSFFVSGYENFEYQRLKDAGWSIHTWQMDCSIIPRTKESGNQGLGSCSMDTNKRTEFLWVSPNVKTARRLI
jgi:DNA adenine methylase